MNQPLGCSFPDADGCTHLGRRRATPVAPFLLWLSLASGTTWAAAPSADFNGDGKSDIFWRDWSSEGQNAIWMRDGFAKKSGQIIWPVADTNWTIVGTGDLNGDGKSDVLWRNRSTGENAIWLMDGFTIVTPQLIWRVTDTNWTVVGTGDFDGDGKADVLWRHRTTGQNAIWLMNGVTIKDPRIIWEVTDTNWTAVGIGDLDGDGKADVFWRNESTGENAIWLMDGVNIKSSQIIWQVTDPGWRVVGTGDFNKDGRADILWRNADTGDNAIWLMDGFAILSGKLINKVPEASWTIAGTGDFNGDGKTDILWRNRSTHQTVIWQMDGFTIPDARELDQQDTKWASITAPITLPSYRLHGLDFSPYTGEQDPNLRSQIGEAQIAAMLDIVKNHTTWIRTFGSTDGLQSTGVLTHQRGLKAAMGAWISDDLAANETELQNLIRAGQNREADLLIVGSEVLRRSDSGEAHLDEAQLLAYINRVKKAVPGIPVSSADTYNVLLHHPNLMNAVDVVLVNYYPYWEGVKVSNAMFYIHDSHKQVVAAANGKPVIVSETGWPSDGNPVGDAVPSLANASSYFLSFATWARELNVPYLYFEAFSEPWKAKKEGPQGAHWGIWDQFGNLKPGMLQVFNGDTVADYWSGVPGGPGKPVIQFTSVPPRLSSNDLRGQVLHVAPGDYKVVVYINVSGWWVKPTFDKPLTTIRPDGTWICDITTDQPNNNDATATAIAAFVIPNAYTPPLLAGSASFPPELIAKAVAVLQIPR